jgi:hypothetical protein
MGCRAFSPAIHLNGVATGFSGTNTNHFFQCRNKDFSIADFTGLGRLGDRFNHNIDVVVIKRNFQFYLGQEIHNVFRTTIEFSVAFLASKTFYLSDSDTLNADLCKRLSDIVQFEGFYNSCNKLHRFTLYILFRTNN